jgi:nitroreductase
MTNLNPLHFLDRVSTPANMLIEPAPNDEQLTQIFRAAMNAPDHKHLQPYRFITIRGEARQALSEVFINAVTIRKPDVDPDYLKKQGQKPLRSPLIVVLVAKLQDDPKVPEIEQILCAGAVANNLMLANNALGFGSIWLTGDNTYDDNVCQPLGLASSEKIIGFIYLGTPKVKKPNRVISDLSDKVIDWIKPL